MTIFVLSLFIFLPFWTFAQMACAWTYQPVCAVSRSHEEGDALREILWTYHNSCVAQARNARIISEGVCTQPSRIVPRLNQQEQPTPSGNLIQHTSQGQLSVPTSQSVREPAKPFADYLQSSDQTLTAMRKSIVTRIENKSLTEKIRFLTTFLETLSNQLTALDTSSPTYTQLATIRTSIQTWLDDAQGQTPATQHTTQPIQSAPPANKTTQRGPISISSDGRTRTPQGNILRGTKNGETIVITFEASSTTTSISKPLRSGQALASGSSFDAIVYSHIRDAICEPRPNTVRTIAYQALRQEAGSFANQQDRVIIVMCRHRPSPKTATSQPLSLIIRPLRLKTIERDTQTILTDLTIVPIDGTYSDVITTQFPSAVHAVLTGKDPTRYQAIIQSLTQINKNM
ncbi:MAG: hypothetical protein NZL83_03855 [Candidatus Absconditabacterales bacterium]|nr:hypothetical protein [Candidatus Absconditabacterales bacterium]